MQGSVLQGVWRAGTNGHHQEVLGVFGFLYHANSKVWCCEWALPSYWKGKTLRNMAKAGRLKGGAFPPEDLSEAIFL